MTDNGLLHSQTHIPRGPSGSVSRMAVGTGGGTVGIGVGATEQLSEGVEATGREINRNSLRICERSMHIINQLMLNELLH